MPSLWEKRGLLVQQEEFNYSIICYREGQILAVVDYFTKSAQRTVSLHLENNRKTNTQYIHTETNGATGLQNMSIHFKLFIEFSVLLLY